MPTLDDGDWLKARVTWEVDRMSLVAILEALEIALGDPEVQEWLREHMREAGRAIAIHLIDEGLVVPEDTRRRWESTFQVPLYET